MVYFRDLTVIRYRRDMYMTWDALFASFGGIFGLCLGGSILSLVELGYFFTVRLLVTIYRKLTDRKEKLEKRRLRRKQKELASGRHVYSLTPVLNVYFKESTTTTSTEKKKTRAAW